MKRDRYFIVNMLPGNTTAEILIYGSIFPWEDCVNAKGFVTELKQLERICSKINVRINCPGGDVYEGIAIFNAIRNSPCDIDTYIDGLAASMGGVIALAGKKVYMSKYARLMTHKPSGGAYGGSAELRKVADEIDDCEKIICDIIVSKTGLSTKAATDKYLNGTDVYVNAEQAKTAGLIDGTYDGDLVDIPANITNQKEMWNVYNHTLAAKLTTNSNSSIIIIS